MAIESGSDSILIQATGLAHIVLLTYPAPQGRFYGYDRRQLKTFENHFLNEYKGYLLTDVPQADPFIQHKYMQQLERLIYRDRNIVDLLKLLQQSSNSELSQAAKRTLQCYQPQSMPK